MMGSQGQERCHDAELVNDAITFTTNRQEQDGQPPPVPGMDSHLFENVRCYACNWNDHYASSCPNSKSRSRESGNHHLTIGLPSGFFFHR